MKVKFILREKILLATVALFLIFGNAARFLPIPASFGNINFGEILLYASGFFLFPILLLEIFRSGIGLTLVLGTVFSIFVGLSLWGFDIQAISYSARLLAQLFISHLIGYILAKRFDSNILSALNGYILVYILIALAAIIIYLLFPESDALWIALTAFGIEFSGDPHIGRLVSLYFDPNFYAAIITLPAIISFMLFNETRRSKYLVFFLITSSTLLLTISRSGIALFFLIFLYITSMKFFYARSFIISRRPLKAIPLVICFMLIVFFFTQDQIDRLINRLSEGVQDDSSTARYDSLMIGMKLFEEHSLFGYGYNFVLPSLYEYGRIGLDSSIQMFIVSYGLLPSIIISFVFALRIFQLNYRFKYAQKEGLISDKIFIKSWRLYLIYFIATLFFAANFNQILFYPFWIVPVLSLLFYFELIYRKLR